MYHKFTALFILSIFFMLGCVPRKPPIQLTTEGEAQDVKIIIALQSPEKQLVIAGNRQEGKGSIYFRTQEGKTWIQGKPEQVIRDQKGWEATWKLSGTTVVLDIEKTGTTIDMELTGAPEEAILGWGVNIKANREEYFTGLFERTVDGHQENSWAEGIQTGMNLRGQEVDMLLKPTLSLYAPFLLSSKGYGMYVKGTWPGHYDLAKSLDDLVQIDFDGPDFTCRFYTSKEPKTIVKQYTMDAGPPILPPKWAFSHWRWRDAHSNNAEYYDGTRVTSPYNSMLTEDILMMNALDIPYGVYWIDRPWAKGNEGYEDFIWDEERFPNAGKMIDWVNKQDANLLLWIAPWVKGNMADTARARGYNLPKKERDYSWPGERELIDFTNQDARDWWKENGPGKMLRQGVKGFKLDRSEEIVPESRDCEADDGRTCRELRNAYPVEYVEATYEISKEVHGDDFVLMPRAGYAHSSRYGVFWGGDIHAQHEGLRASIIAQQRAAVMGYPFWGSDIGGYWGGPLEPELLSRWLAFGCFSPIMEVGPNRNIGLWDMPNGPAYNPELLATWRLYAKLHTRLMDYSYKHAEQAHTSGMPVVRPLFLHYPQQQQAWEDWQTFMYGRDILVSAIWQDGKRTHSLYLPKGETWVDAWNGKTYEGGQTVEVDAPLYKIPIFVRKGASVDLGDLNALYQESLEITQKEPDIEQLQQNAAF